MATANDLAASYNLALTAAIDQVAPLKLRTQAARPTKSKPWFSPALHELLAKKRSCEAVWSKTQSPADRQAYTTAAAAYKKAIINAKALAYNTRIENAPSSSRELFAILRELETPLNQPTTLAKDEAWCTAIQNALTTKIDTLQNKIASKLASLPSEPEQPHPFPPTCPPFRFTLLTETEVASIIRSLKPSPCKGDICPAQIIKDCSDHLLPTITAFINASFTNSSVPNCIKEAWVTPLLKKPSLDPACPTNYRPITNVPFLLKILDRAAYLQVQKYLEDNHLLGSRQSGFRPGHGTETALLDLKIQLDEIRDAGDLAALLLLDLSAAFDLVDHDILCKQLTRSVNFSDEATLWLSSFLSNRTSRVFSGNCHAPATSVPCGVPQGSCISPTLYNIYTKPLFDHLDQLGVRYTNFADDTQILIPLTGDHTQDTLLLNDIYAVVQAWMAKHHLCLNDDKTELLVVGPPHRIKSLPPTYSSFNIAGINIPVLKSVKTLGVHIEADLSMCRQTNAIISSSAYHLKLINGIRPFLTTNNCATIARAVVGAKLDYCNVLLCGTSQRNIQKLQTVQNNTVRVVMGLSRRDHVSDARRSLHWLPVKQRIEFKTLSLAHRCLSGKAPSYLCPSITPHLTTRTLRSSNNHTLTIPRFRRQRAGGSSFPVIAPTLWNSLPIDLRSEPSYWRFRKGLKTKLFC